MKKIKKHIYNESPTHIEFTYIGGENEWQECSNIALGTNSLVCETYGEIVIFWLYSPLYKEALCKPTKIEKGRVYDCSLNLETKKLTLFTMPTRYELKFILKHVPHKWTLGEFGPDLTCKVCGNKLDGYNNKVAKVYWNDLSESAKRDRIKLDKKLQKGVKPGELSRFDLHALYDGSITYAPVNWFDEQYYIEENAGEDEMFKSNFHCWSNKMNAIKDGTYSVCDTGLLQNIKMDAEIIDCPYCKNLYDVLNFGRKYWPLNMKIKCFFNYRLTSYVNMVNNRLKKFITELMDRGETGNENNTN